MANTLVATVGASSNPASLDPKACAKWNGCPNIGEELRAYRGQWIAVKEDTLVAHSQDLHELMRALEAQRIALPFLTQLPSDDRRYLILAV